LNEATQKTLQERAVGNGHLCHDRRKLGKVNKEGSEQQDSKHKGRKEKPPWGVLWVCGGTQIAGRCCAKLLGEGPPSEKNSTGNGSPAPGFAWMGGVIVQSSTGSRQDQQKGTKKQVSA